MQQQPTIVLPSEPRESPTSPTTLPIYVLFGVLIIILVGYVIHTYLFLEPISNTSIIKKNIEGIENTRQNTENLDKDLDGRIQQDNMKLLIVFNNLRSEFGTFEIDTPLKLSSVIKQHKDPTEIIICTGPANYTTFRKGIAIGLAFQSYYKCNLFGFSLIEHYLPLFHNKCFYNEKNIVWINNEGNFSMENIKNIEVLEDFVGNINFCNNKVIDCSIENIWKFIDSLKYSIEQTYYDKYKWQ